MQQRATVKFGGEAVQTQAVPVLSELLNPTRIEGQECLPPSSKADVDDASTLIECGNTINSQSDVKKHTEGFAKAVFSHPNKIDRTVEKASRHQEVSNETCNHTIGSLISSYMEKGIQTPMAQGRSTKTIPMIRWIHTSRLSIKISLSSTIPCTLPRAVRSWGGGPSGASLSVNSLGLGLRV